MQDADLHMAQLMPLPLTVSCFSKIQIGFAYLVPAHLGSPRKKEPLNGCVCVCVTLVQAHPGSPRKTAITRVCMCYCVLVLSVSLSVELMSNILLKIC